MVGQIKLETRDIKVAVLEKRSQNKSAFTVPNYTTRVFVLEPSSLKYYIGTVEDRQLERGSIDLTTVMAVESVQDGLLQDKTNAFQIVYHYHLDGEPISLYIVAPDPAVRDSWITAIRTEAIRQGASLASQYHPGLVVEGFYNCCGKEKDGEGCKGTAQASMAASGVQGGSVVSMSSLGSGQALQLSNLLIEVMLKRSQGKSVFFTKENYKKRTFVLDANSLRYYDGDVRIKKNEKGRIHLSCVVTVEPAELTSENYKHAFQVCYFDEYELFRLYVIANSKESQEQWIKTIKREAIKMGAEFLPSYHPGMFIKSKGKWECCQDINKLNEGCRRIIAQPDMKLCGADLNVSVTASMRGGREREVKVGCMVKKSQNKSTFFSSNNYQNRVFTLDDIGLAYYSGYLEDRGELRCSIPFVDMLLVENVKDGMLDDKINVFQVVYREDKKMYSLYIVAESEMERQSWITAIKRGAARSNVYLLHRYHPGVWIKALGRYNCCERINREAPGCADVTGMSLISMRDRLNTMDSVGPRHRLGTLDSVPENAILGTDPSKPQSALRHKRKTENEHIQHQYDKKQQKQDQQQQRQNTNQKENYMELKQKLDPIKAVNQESFSLKEALWNHGVNNLTMSTVGPRLVSHGQNFNGSASSNRYTNSGIINSRQGTSTTLDLSTQYSEDFESVSEMDI